MTDLNTPKPDINLESDQDLARAVYFGYTDAVPIMDKSRAMLIPSGLEDDLDGDDIIAADIDAKINVMVCFMAKGESQQSIEDLLLRKWQETTGSDIELEFITSEINACHAKFQEVFSRIKPDTFKYWLPFFLYKKDSDEAKAEAKKTMLTALFDISSPHQ